jgi:hypothetical protein
MFWGADTTDLAAGAYIIHNGAGGSDVGAFRIDFPVGSSFQWTNKMTSVNAGQDLTVTWAAEKQDAGYVTIDVTLLTFARDPNGYGLGGIRCLERADKGSFTIPGWMIWTDRAVTADTLGMQVQYHRRQEFSAPGLDFGEFLYALKAENQRAKIIGR